MRKKHLSASISLIMVSLSVSACSLLPNITPRINSSTTNQSETSILPGGDEDGYFAYYENDDHTYSVGASSYLESNSVDDLVIPEEYNGQKVTSIIKEGFSRIEVNGVLSIPRYIKEIGPYAFMDTTMKEVVWNAIDVDALQFGYNIFAGCHRLERLDFSDGVKSVPDYLIWENYTIKDIHFSNGITYIGADAFVLCHGLETINLPDSVKVIGAGAFQSCSSLTDVNLGNGVEVISNNAFLLCSSLRNIKMSESLKEIDWSAFEQCDALDYNIHNDVCYLGNDNNPYLACIKSNNKNANSIRLHPNCLIISTDALSYNENMREITLNDNLKSISRFAFAGSANLLSLHIPGSVSYIGEGILDSCHSLTELTIDPNNAYYCVEDDTLYDAAKTTLYCHANNSAVTNLVLPDSLRIIEESSFSSCANLLSITLPDELEIIVNNPFSSCPNLRFNIENGCYYVPSKSHPHFALVRSETQETSCSVADDCKFILSMSFFGNSVVTNISIPSSVKTIGASAFDGSNLRIVDFAVGIENIGGLAFANCRNLETINLPKTIKQLGYGVFTNCNSLKEIILPSIEEIPSSTFSECLSLNRVALPEGVKIINELAFDGCKNLNEIVLPTSIKYIAFNAFNNCNILETVFYLGNEIMWQLIDAPFTEGNVYYYSENEPAREGQYWRYVNGLPTIW